MGKGLSFLGVVVALILSAHPLEAQQVPDAGSYAYRAFLRTAFSRLERFAVLLVPFKIPLLADGGGDGGGGGGDGGGGDGGGSGSAGGGDGTGGDSTGGESTSGDSASAADGPSHCEQCCDAGAQCDRGHRDHRSPWRLHFLRRAWAGRCDSFRETGPECTGRRGN